MDNLYIYFIVALLPISALMLMIQVNPYQALVIRGILGAIAVLSYIILGAADVALTEALMGTLLGVVLYIIAVRSCFVMRLGVLENEPNTADDTNFESIIKDLKKVINQVYLRLELVRYTEPESLENALNNRDIHGYLIKNNAGQNYVLTMRIKRLYDMIKKEVFNANIITDLYINNNSVSDSKNLEKIN